MITNKILYFQDSSLQLMSSLPPSRLICLHFLDISPPPHSAAYMGTTHSPKTPGSISASASKSVGGPNRVRKWRNWHWKDLLYTETRRPYDPHICPGKKKDKWARFHSPKAVSWDIPFLFEFRTRLRIWEKNGGASAQKCHAEGGSAAENWGNFLFWKALLVDLNLEKCFFYPFLLFPHWLPGNNNCCWQHRPLPPLFLMRRRHSFFPTPSFPAAQERYLIAQHRVASVASPLAFSGSMAKQATGWSRNK